MRTIWLAVLTIGFMALIQTAQGEEPLAGSGEPGWFRGNLHTHSLWSDGNDFPEMIVDWYVNQGYQFLALSDHNTLSQGQRWMSIEDANKRAGQDSFSRYKSRLGDTWIETKKTTEGVEQVRLKPLGEYRTLFERPGQFLLIQGEEITDRFEKKPIHLNATNLVELVKPQGGSSVVDTIQRNLEAVQEQAKRTGQPIVTHLNHPNFGYAITAEELAMATRERFFEVYNGHPGVNHQGDATHASIERMWDIINTLRLAELKVAPVYGLATDDSHNYFGTSGSSPGRGWVMVRAPFLTPEGILAGIEQGDFYASSGVTLDDVHYDVQNKALKVQVKPEEGVTYTIQFIGTRKGYDASRRPVEAEDGAPLEVTQRYSADVGAVLASVSGPLAEYRLTGNELYVRAVVTSDKPPTNPSFAGQMSQAWTQPVGWEQDFPGAAVVEGE